MKILENLSSIISQADLSALYKNLNVTISIGGGELKITMPDGIRVPQFIAEGISSLASFKRERDSNETNTARFSFSNEHIDEQQLTQIVKSLFFSIGIESVSNQS